jgi:Cu/Ag efflux pump CusA
MKCNSIRWHGIAVVLTSVFLIAIPKAICAENESNRVVITVIAPYTGASAEETERQVTIPLEVAFAGMPKLKSIRTRSVFGIGEVHLEFDNRLDHAKARQEVINRLQLATGLPPGVVPQISTGTSADGVFCYVLRSPRNAAGVDIYTLNDLRALQDWVLEREFRRVPGLVDVVSRGGTIKRYEVHLDPDRLRRFGLTVAKVATALSTANQNIGGIIKQGDVALNVRGVGLFGGGEDPVSRVLELKDPNEAVRILRQDEEKRIREIRKIVVDTINNNPVLIDNLVEGGPLTALDTPGNKGVVVGHLPRTGEVRLGRSGSPDVDVVEGIVFARPGEDRQEVIERVEARIKELNKQPGKLLPGVQIEPCYKSTAPGKWRAAGDNGSVIWIEGRFPVKASPKAISEAMSAVRALLLDQPQVREVVTEIGQTDSTESTDPNRVLCLVLLKPEKDWPDKPKRKTLSEWQKSIHIALTAKIAGADWELSEQCSDTFDSTFIAAPGRHLLKITGPDLEKLEQLAEQARKDLATSAGIEEVRVNHVAGRPTLNFRVDREKCAKYGVTATDVNNVIEMALSAKSATAMLEGEKSFDIALLWPAKLRESETTILDIPVDIPVELPKPNDPIKNTPRLRLRDLVSPLGKDGQPDPEGQFAQAGAAAIYRENGKRLISIRFRVDSPEATTVLADAKKKLAPLVTSPYQAEWQSGR